MTATRGCYMWGHAYEFERDHAWTLMETLAGMLGGMQISGTRPTSRFFPISRIIGRLVYSADAGLVFNPTASMIWLESSWTLFTVGAWRNEAGTQKAGKGICIGGKVKAV